MGIDKGEANRTAPDWADSPVLDLLPAVDIAGGRSAHLGPSAAEVDPLGDPLQAALRWQADGAGWLHLVDLDAAYGRGHNREALTHIVGVLDIDVEISGGVADDESLQAAMDTGCRRVVISTAALSQPSWCANAIATYGDQVALGLDVRGRTLSARGTSDQGGDLLDALARFDEEGCARYVVTDVTTDGALGGPNLPLLGQVCGATDRPIVASGGVAQLSDLEALTALVPLGLEAAIIGTALYDRRFSLPDALTVAQDASRSR